jgi:YgiT-type zinc finger domain-containing protein
MDTDPVVTQCQKMLEETLRSLADWRQTAPKATFAEIEDAVEEQVAAFRATLITDLVNARAAETVSEAPPACPGCGQRMERRGTAERTVTVRGNRTVRVRRGHAVCPTCGVGLFPPR